MTSIFIELESVDMFYDIIKHSRLCILDFYADWCIPCKKLIPILNNVVLNNKLIRSNLYQIKLPMNTKSLENKIIFLKINIDNFQELAEAFNVESIPYIVICKSSNDKNNFIPIDKISDGNVEHVIKSIEQNY